MVLGTISGLLKLLTFVVGGGVLTIIANVVASINIF